MKFIMKSMSCDIEKSSWLRKSLFIMRCILLFLLLGTMEIAASVAYSQSVKLSLNLENTSVQEVLSIIEQKSAFYFTYNLKQIHADRKVSVKVNNESVTDILDKLFANEGIKYVINDKHIVLFKADEKNQPRQNLDIKTITGVVTDINGEPVIGVNIIEKGTTNGTVTDLDGRFTLQVSPSSVLQISFIGYVEQHIVVGAESSFAIKLLEDTQKLDEVVVVGYEIGRAHV